MTTPTTEVRFGRLERRGLLMGLTGAQLALVGSALILVVSAGMAAGPAGLLVMAPAWGAALTVALIPVGGRPLAEVLPVATAWAARRGIGACRVIARPCPVAATAPIAVAGVSGQLRITADPTSGAAMIRVGRARAGGSVTVAAEIRGHGFLLENAGTQERRLGAWGRLLGSLSHLPGITSVQVLHRAVPSSGREVRQWWAAQAAGASSWAARVVDDLVADLNVTSVQALLAVTIRPRRGADIEGVLGSLTGAFDAAELELIGWLTPDQICRVIREAYDPAGAAAAPMDDLAHCVPMGVAEDWSYARTDSAFHATYWISEWPRSGTHPGFLRPLLLAGGAQRTFTLLAQPLPPGKALREIRRARAEQMADAATRARIGRVEDEGSRAAAVELSRREEDLIAGHGDLRFVGLLAVSAATRDELAGACAATESAAATAGCELRRLVGQQVSAYAAAALPLARGLR